MLKNLFILLMLTALGYGIHSAYKYYSVIPNQNICANFTFNNAYSFINSDDKNKMLNFHRRRVSDCRKLVLNHNLYFKYDRNTSAPCAEFMQELGSSTRNYADFVAQKWGDRDLARLELRETLKYFQDYRYCPTSQGQNVITRERIEMQGKLRDI